MCTALKLVTGGPKQQTQYPIKKLWEKGLHYRLTILMDISVQLYDQTTSLLETSANATLLLPT